jgi:hypothetical protein
LRCSLPAHRDKTKKDQKKAYAGRPGKFVAAGNPRCHQTTRNTGKYRPRDARHHVTSADASHIEGNDGRPFTCSHYAYRESKARDDPANSAKRGHF